MLRISESERLRFNLPKQKCPKPKLWCAIKTRMLNRITGKSGLIILGGHILVKETTILGQCMTQKKTFHSNRKVFQIEM